MNKLYQKIRTTAALLFIGAAANFATAQTVQCITDGGFEAGPGAGTWIETSTNFGTPLCDLAGCGNGTGTGAHAGTFWAWFGGFPGGVEQSEISQFITIPATATTANLTFFLEQIVCDGPTDYMVVIVDADTVFSTDGSSPLCGVLGYAQQTINMMAYADGLPHTLIFSSTTFSVNTGGTNFFVDDVSLLAITPVVVVDCADTVSFAPALAITDGDSLGVSDAQTVSGISGTLGSSVNLVNISITATHTWVGDIRFVLTAPNGTSVNLLDRPGVPASTFGCDGDDFDFSIVRGTGNEAENICAPAAPAIAGNFTASFGLDLNAINLAGGSPNGTWTLAAADFATPDSGIIANWSLVFSSGPVASIDPIDSVCSTSGSINLNNYILGTTGGTFTGAGVTDSIFDPAGLSGNIAITYTVTDGGGCVDSTVATIFVVGGLPVASFTSSSGGNTVTFTNTSVNAASYLWNFGDGNTSTATSPSHAYGSSGTFTVSLTATNLCGTSGATQTVVTGCAPDTFVVNDGGFEAGIGAGTWVETSTNFGTSLCDVGSCGTGTGTGPHNGTIWCWIGGSAAAVEQAGVEQSNVLIPIGTASLSFYLEQIVCDDPTDYMVVVIDADTVFASDGASPLCGQLGYSLITVDVSAKADGNTHTVSVNGTTFAVNGGVTNFFVDDITIGVCTASGISEVLSGASVTVTPNPASDKINLNFTNVKDRVEVSAFNEMGQQVYDSTFNQTGNNSQSIDISKWNAGVYTVKVKAYNQEFVKKVVKN